MPFDQNFAIVPREVFEHADLTAHARMVYCAMCAYRNQQSRACFPSIRRLSADTALSRNRITEATRELMAFGLVKRVETKGIHVFKHQANVYELPEVENWKETPEAEVYRADRKRLSDHMKQVSKCRRIGSDTGKCIDSDTGSSISSDTGRGIDSDTRTDHDRPFERNHLNDTSVAQGIFSEGSDEQDDDSSVNRYSTNTVFSYES